MPTAFEIFRDKEKFIDNTLLGLESDVTVLQKELLRLILDDYLSEFTYDSNGNIINNSANINRANNIDKVFVQFNDSFQKKVIKDYSNNILKLTVFSKDYFSNLDKSFKAETLDKFPKLQANINASLGIRQKTIDGKKVQVLTKNGYLDRLILSEPLKSQLKDYVVNSVTSNISLKDYQRGFKELLTQTDKFDGELVKYYRNYAYDTMNQVDAVSNLYYADQLGLEYFIYEGSLIKTSHPFCCKRAQKVFSRNDVDSWKNDIDLIQKSTKEAYKPLIERGRYNCRHNLRYISDDLANEKGITKSKDINKRKGSLDCPDKKK